MTVRGSTLAATRVPAADRAAPFLVGLAATLLMASAIVTSAAHAAPVDRTLFTWTGRVDREVYLVIRGRDIRTRGEDAGLPNRVRVNDPLPRAAGAVIVRMNDGRGTADVVEQPSARNGYQATIRIRDPRAGADSYRLTAYWQGDDRYDDRRPGNNDTGGWGYGRNGRDDNRDNGNRDRDRDRDRNDRNDRSGGDDGRGGRDDTGRYESGTLRWSGRVDDVVEIRLSGRRVDAVTRSGVMVQDVATNIRGSGLPQRAVTVQIDQRAGRGAVDVVQQPSAWNGYTAVIRIYDPRGGAAFYDFSASW